MFGIAWRFTLSWISPQSPALLVRTRIVSDCRIPWRSQVPFVAQTKKPATIQYITAENFSSKCIFNGEKTIWACRSPLIVSASISGWISRSASLVVYDARQCSFLTLIALFIVFLLCSGSHTAHAAFFWYVWAPSLYVHESFRHIQHWIFHRKRYIPLRSRRMGRGTAPWRLRVPKLALGQHCRALHRQRDFWLFCAKKNSVAKG